MALPKLLKKLKERAATNVNFNEAAEDPETEAVELIAVFARRTVSQVSNETFRQARRPHNVRSFSRNNTRSERTSNTRDPHVTPTTLAQWGVGGRGQPSTPMRLELAGPTEHYT
ncbi:hypothetical protein EVAR_25677_1 [Eumeta japonica]|uniref:Uncharacterized protein n=1 Tax=Eumeta variegata TaxID=151549 RepID=A0A4C1WEG9_EUMVA|nr:hypothetical protein EVAR_25677_1 [Eumeta japonica]